MRTMPAAAIQEGTVVRIEIDGTSYDFLITKVSNSDPRPGRITWTILGRNAKFEVGGAERVLTVSLP